MTMVYVGIDLACGRNKRLPICFASKIGNTLQPIPVSASDMEQIPRGPGNQEIRNKEPFRATALAVASAIGAIAAKNNWAIARIAIDAPAAPAKGSKRKSEQDLRRHRQSFFQTPNEAQWEAIHREISSHFREGRPVARLPNANRIWMLYGFGLFKELRRQGHKVIEVFPYSTVCSITPGCPHKSTSEGYRRQLEAVARRTGWPSPEQLEAEIRCVPGSRHDRLDAYMSAWVASLGENERRVYGDRDNCDDAIWAPLSAA